MDLTSELSCQWKALEASHANCFYLAALLWVFWRCPHLPISLSFTVSFRLGIAALPDVPDTASAQASLAPSSFLLLCPFSPPGGPLGQALRQPQAALSPWSSGALRLVASAKPGPLSLFPCLPLTLKTFRPEYTYSVLQPTQVELSRLPEMREEPLAGGTYSTITLSTQIPLRDSHFLKWMCMRQ